MPHILQYISEHWAPPPEVKTENGHMHQEGDAPPPQTAQLLAAIITVRLQHGRLRCAAIRLDGMQCPVRVPSTTWPVSPEAPPPICVAVVLS